MEDDQEQRPESLLPYDHWTMEAMRLVVTRALAHVAAEGLPGEHHFYLTFRTDYPGAVVPPRLLAQYPHEMTIVLQHQFRDLQVDEAQGVMSVGLSFGGIPTALVVPLAAISAFADPFARVGMQFEVAVPEAPAEPEAPPEEPPPAPDESVTPQVVSLDAFRRRTPPKED